MNILTFSPSTWSSQALQVLREVEYLLPKAIATGISLAVILTLLVLIHRQRKRIKQKKAK